MEEFQKRISLLLDGRITMNRDELYSVLRGISVELATADDAFKILPDVPNWSASLEELGIDLISGQEYFRLLEKRIPTKKFRIKPNLVERLQMFSDLGDLCNHLINEGFERPGNFEVVYVDDEAENLFIFKRKFGKRLNLKTFEDPREALEYILKRPSVSVVVTDEVMPGLSGSQLCDEVHKSKPNMKFVLITGNPNNDGDLMYNSLRKNRFYEFINKPVDFDGKGEEYYAMILSLASFDW
jgi:CheY-like chemotaxis protein